MSLRYSRLQTVTVSTLHYKRVLDYFLNRIQNINLDGIGLRLINGAPMSGGLVTTDADFGEPPKTPQVVTLGVVQHEEFRHSMRFDTFEKFCQDHDPQLRPATVHEFVEILVRSYLRHINRKPKDRPGFINVNDEGLNLIVTGSPWEHPDSGPCFLAFCKTFYGMDFEVAPIAAQGEVWSPCPSLLVAEV